MRIIMNYFVEMTMMKWVLWSLLSFSFYMLCQQLLSYWSDRHRQYLEVWQEWCWYRLTFYFIVWPLSIPTTILGTAFIFTVYKRYELDRYMDEWEEKKKILEQMKEEGPGDDSEFFALIERGKSEKNSHSNIEE